MQHQSTVRDPVMSYLWGILMPETFSVVTWIHTCDHTTDKQCVSRTFQVAREQIVRKVIHNGWRDVVGRRQVYLAAVFPPPLDGFQSVPHFIATTFRPAEHFPVLFVRNTPQGTFRGTRVLQTKSSQVLVQWLFDMLVPTHQCIFSTNRHVFLRNIQLMWGMSLSVQAGTYLLFEVQPLSDSDSACDESSTGQAETLGSEEAWPSAASLPSEHGVEEHLALLQRSVYAWRPSFVTSFKPLCSCHLLTMVDSQVEVNDHSCQDPVIASLYYANFCDSLRQTSVKILS